VWVEASQVAWVIEALHRQWHGGGVEFTPEASTLMKPYFSIRDRCWQARARTPAGELVRRTFTVPKHATSVDGKKRDFSIREFMEEKEKHFKKATAWQETVEAGTQYEDV